MRLTSIAGLATPPTMRASQQLFVPPDLIEQIFKCSFDGSRRCRSRFLCRHLARRQPQIQRDGRAFAWRILFHRAFQVHELWLEHLQAFLDLSCSVLYFLFYLRGLRNFVTDVDIHARLGYGRRSREALQSDSTPDAALQNLKCGTNFS